MRLLLVTVTVLLVAAAPASAAYTIRTNADGQITKIGDLRTRGGQPPTFDRATAVFGRPTRVAPVGNGGEACTIEWSMLKLRTTFANFGGGRACAPAEGVLQRATTRSRKFRTAKDLRVGDPSSTIKEKYPKARFRRNVWQIVTAPNPAGEESTEIATIEATVKKGRIEVLRLWIGAAGD
jgi:hypothetical protein